MDDLAKYERPSNCSSTSPLDKSPGFEIGVAGLEISIGNSASEALADASKLRIGSLNLEHMADDQSPRLAMWTRMWSSCGAEVIVYGCHSNFAISGKFRNTYIPALGLNLLGFVK